MYFFQYPFSWDLLTACLGFFVLIKYILFINVLVTTFVYNVINTSFTVLSIYSFISVYYYYHIWPSCSMNIFNVFDSVPKCSRSRAQSIHPPSLSSQRWTTTAFVFQPDALRRDLSSLARSSWRIRFVSGSSRSSYEAPIIGWCWDSSQALRGSGLFLSCFII